MHEADGFSDWLWEEIRKAIPASLAMANDVEYYWGDDKRTMFPREARDDTRNRTIAWAQENLTATMLARNLGRADPAALSHFVTRRHVDSASNFQASSWRWLVPHMVGAMKIAPDVVTPQVCLVVCYSETGRTLHVPNQWRRDSGYGLDAALLDELVPDEVERKAFLDLLAAAPNPEAINDLQMRAIVIGVRDDAQRVLETFEVRAIEAPSAAPSELPKQAPRVESDSQVVGE